MKRAALVLLFVPLMALAEGPPVIAVLDFASSGIPEAEVRIFTDYITSHIIDTGVYRVIDRTQRAAILSELEFAASDCTDEGCQLEIGKLLAASQIVVGSLGTFQDVVILTIKLIDVQSGVALQTASERYRSMKAMIDDSRRLTRALVGKAKPVARPAAKYTHPLRKAGWLVGLAGLAGTAGGTVLGYVGFGRGDDTSWYYTLYSDRSDATADFQALWDAYVAAYRRVSAVRIGGITLGASGLVAVVAGVVMIAYRRPIAQPGLSLRLDASAGYAGVRLGY